LFTVGIDHQSASVLLLAHHVTICQLVGELGNVNASCFNATCASVAITVLLLELADVFLLGTLGLVENVLVPATV
jgi:hypothetical protein